MTGAPRGVTVSALEFHFPFLGGDERIQGGLTQGRQLPPVPRYYRDSLKEQLHVVLSCSQICRGARWLFAAGDQIRCVLLTLLGGRVGQCNARRLFVAPEQELVPDTAMRQCLEMI